MAFVMNDEPAGDGERVVILERHPDHPHPGGEIFITTGSGATEVARTAAERASVDADRLYDSIKQVQQRSSGLNENEHK